MRILFHAPGLAVHRPEVPLYPTLGVPAEISQTMNALKVTHAMTGNRGNIIHAEAPARILEKNPTRSVFANISRLHTDLGPAFADTIAEHFDIIVLSMANFIRPKFDGAAMLASLKALEGRVPFVVLGAGLQGVHHFSAMQPSTRDLLALLNERAALFAVRGQQTAAWLAKAGFKNTKILGCPSLYVYPQSILAVSGRIPRKKGRNVNIMTAGHVSIVDGKLQRRGKNLLEALSGLKASYVFQDEFFTFGQVADRQFSFNEGNNTVSAPLMNRWLSKRHGSPVKFARYYYFTEAGAWRLGSLNHDLFLGDRFHGGVAALQAARPAIFLTQDNRVTELTEHFDLPRLTMAEFVKKGIERTMEECISDEALMAMKKKYRQRHAEFVAAMANVGLKVTTHLPPEPVPAVQSALNLREHKVS